MSRSRRRPRGRSWSRRSVVLALVVLLLAVPGVSYAQALTAPGGGSFDVRSVSWLQDHGFAAAINRIETWRYSRDAPPSNGAIPAGSLPSAALPKVTAPPRAPTPNVPATMLLPQGPRLPVLPMLPGLPLIAGEGRWVPAGQSVDGAPAAWRAYFRPDIRHTSVLAGVLWLDQSRVVTTLAPGLGDPGRITGAWQGAVPSPLQPKLVATWNAGFRFRDGPGGFAVAGTTARPLVPGLASVVVDTAGRIDVRAWAGGPTPEPGVAAVRQNLRPVVLQGRAVPELATNPGSGWGRYGQQMQYTSRTGIGVTSSGDVVVVQAPSITLSTLGELLVRAGARTGMQLDIHNTQVSVNVFPAGARGTTPTRLLPATNRPANRYLVADNRDFFAAFVRGTSLPGQRP